MKAQVAALELAAQALFELEHANHSQALLLALAALRAGRSRSTKRPVSTAAAPSLLVSRALRRCLAETVPWRHLWGHYGALHALEWNPDGHWILALDNLFVSLWDSATMQLDRQFVFRSGQTVPALELVQPVHGESILEKQNRLYIAGLARENMAAQLSWHPNGEAFLLVWPGDFAGLYDAVTGTLQACHPSPPIPFRTIRWHQHGPLFLTLDDDQHVACVLDWTRETSRQFDRCAHASLSPDGSTLAVAALDGSVRLWRVSDGTMLHQLADSGSAVSALAWKPDGNQLLAARADGSVCLWDTVAGALQRTLSGHPSAVAQAAWSPDGRYLLTSDARLAHCWNVATWEVMSTRLYEHEMATKYRALEWNPDSQYVLASSGFFWSLWHAPSGQRHSTETWHRYSRSVWNPSGHMIATYGDDMNCLIWQTTGREPQQRLAPRLHCTSVHEMNGIVYGLAQDIAGELQLRDLATDRVLWQITCPGTVRRAALSPDGTRLCISQVMVHSDVPSLWDTASGTLVANLSAHFTAAIFTCRAIWHPTEPVFALQADDQPILICDGQRGQVLTRLTDPTWIGPRDTIDMEAQPAVAWSPEGDRLLAASASGTRIWDWRTGAVASASPALWSEEWLCAVGWGQDGPQLLTWSFSGRATLWEAQTGEPTQVLEGSVHGLRAAAWSPNRCRIVAVDQQAAWIWDSQTGKALQLLEGNIGTSPIRSIAWIQYGRSVLTCDYNGAVQMWIVDAELLEAELIRRIGEIHVESTLGGPKHADTAIRQVVPSWRGWRREQAAFAAAVQKYDDLS